MTEEQRAEIERTARVWAKKKLFRENLGMANTPANTEDAMNLHVRYQLADAEEWEAYWNMFRAKQAVYDDAVR
jgi:hypothetical protein